MPGARRILRKIRKLTEGNRLIRVGGGSSTRLMIRFTGDLIPDQCQVQGTNDVQTVRGNSGIWISGERYSTLALALVPIVAGQPLPPIQFNERGEIVDGGDGGLTENPTILVAGFACSSGGGVVSFSWTSSAEPNLEIYIIKRKGPGQTQFEDALGVTPMGAGSSYSDSNTPPTSGTYTYRLTAMLLDGVVEDLAQQTVTV